MSSKEKIQKLLSLVDIKINGSRDWDIQVYNEKLYSRVLAGGALALGESYMDGWWDCKTIDQFIYRTLRGDLKEKIIGIPLILSTVKAKLLNLQTTSRSKEVGKKHYDIGNRLYKLMLDKELNYSCACWKNAKNLDKAQENKLDLICRKIGLKKGQRVLDIGCGWGSFAKHAARKYKAKVVGITISKEQVKLAKENCKGLPIEIRFQDYRDLNEKFDHIISIGMFEHVGYKNYNTFFDVARKHLKDDGLFLLHTIGGNRSSYGGDPWVLKYIFPNSMLPSVAQIGKAIERKFVMEDWHNFSADYEKTLLAWYDNFEKSWPELAKLQDEKGELIYSDRFYRMWRYYLLMFAGTFRARTNQLWQIVLSPRGVRGGYQSIR